MNRKKTTLPNKPDHHQDRRPLRARFILGSIAAQLNTMSIIAILGLLILGGTTLFTLTQYQRQVERLAVLSEISGKLDILLANIFILTTNLDEIIETDNTSLIGETLAGNESMLTAFSEFTSTAQELDFKRELGYAVENEPVFLAIRDETFDILSLYRNGNVAEATQAKKRLDIKVRSVLLFVEEASASQNNALTDELAQEQALRQQLLLLVIGVVATTIVLVLGIGLLIARSISSRLRALTLVTAQIAAGDLNAQASVDSKDEIGTLGTTFNMMTTQLRQTLEEVQHQTIALQSSTKTLSRQALQLQAATEVSRAVSSELDADELIKKAVNLVRDRFDLYYVGLFLLDEQRRFAVLDAGTGEVSREMLESGHKLEVNDDSMIGWCITHKQARIILDVGEEAVRFNNPLLPNTRSELALPLISQGQVLGAMTVQSEQESAFTEEDVTILQTMTDQLANGIEKARLYEQIQQRAIELDKAREVADSAKDEAENARVIAEEANRSLAAQMWQTAGQAALNEKMRGEQDIASLANNVIQHLCKYLEIYSGAVYIVEDKLLRLTGTYAYRRKSFAQEYKLGEDLVGEAAAGKEIISNEIPEDYITFDLGEGKILPRFRLIVPVIYNQEVSGVVALESMRGFTPVQKRFVEQAIESVAIAFMTARARTRVNELLAQTRQQAEELQAQEEELRATNEELEAQTESLRASENRLKTNQVTKID